MADRTPAPVMVAMCGIPFAGKTTLARLLAERAGMTLVVVDAAVGSGRFDIGSGGTRGIGWARAIAVSFRQALELLGSGESVVFDHANHTRRSRDRYRRLASEAEARFVGVWVATDAEAAWQRLLENRTAPVRGNVPDASFRQIVDEFEPPVDEPDVIRWQAGMSVDDVLTRIRRVAA